MRNVVELREELSKVFNSLNKGDTSAKEAKELANIAGKMINSAKVQLEYHALRKDTPSILFLHAEEDID